MSSSQERSWLVKSSGVILGPYNLEEMIQALTERRIAIIDEIRSPQSRWSFIREHPQFASVVQFLREQQNQSKDDTAATFIGTKTKTLTITKTEDVEETKIPDVNFKIPTGAKTEAPASAASSEAKPATKYAFGADPKVRRQIRRTSRKSSRLAWILLLFIIVSGFFAYQNLQQEKSKTLTYEDYVRLAKSDRSMGNYERALQFLRKADAMKPLDLSGQILMAPLLMITENQNIQARRQLEQALNNYKGEEKSKQEAQSLIALSYLREGQLEEAEKIYQALLAKNSDYEPAQINLLEILVLKGDFSSAYQNLTKMMKEKIKDPCLIIYRALVSYRLFEEDKGKEKLNLSLEDLKRFRAKSSDYQAEALLIQAAIEKKLYLQAESKASLRELVMTYPDLTKDHYHNELIHREILGWKYLANICQILSEGNEKDSVESKGLLAFCSYEQGDLKTALDQIEKAASQYSNESLLYGLRAFLLLRSGRTSEAQALTSLPDSQDSLLLKAVEAQICEKEKNEACAEKAWKSLLEKQNTNILALAGLAKIAVNSGNRETAADYVMRGWLKSSNYRPILEIKDQLEQR